MTPELPPELAFDWRQAVEDIVHAVKHHLKNTNATRVVLGLSGGVDSSVTAALMVKALGPGKVHALLLPEAGVTPPEDLEDARAVARQLGLDPVEIEIGPLVREFIRAIPALSEAAHRIPLANLKPRIRMTILYAYSNMMGDAQVAGTGDKSELLLGYFTKYGDGGVDFLPLGDLYKTQVRYLAWKLGLPERIWRKKPSPQLWRGQTAEEEIGAPYELVDRILYYRVEQRYPEEMIAERLSIDPEHVRRVCSRVYQSHHKRKAPPICKLGSATINWDWRMPHE